MLNNNLFLINLSPSPMVYTLLLFFFLNCVNNFSWLIQKFIYMYMLVILFLFYLVFFYLNMLLNENYFMGFLSKKKKKILSNGFTLFIFSEFMIFMSLFWSYIHNSFVPNMSMGNFWPPKGLISANPTGMIIFGTSILLSSSLVITITHMNMMKNFKNKSMKYFFFCIFMGMIFIDMQILEMSNFIMKLNFNFNDSIFSSSFLFTTTLHASHVLLGLIGLIYSYLLMKKNLNSNFFFLNLEFSIWYWHFVDYIWIGVFSLFYYMNN